MRCAATVLLPTVLLLASLSGCRQDPFLGENIELMNAERRALEEQVFQLEYEYEQREKELERCRREKAQLEAAGGRPPAEDHLELPDIEVPEIEVPPSDAPDAEAPDAELPEIDPGTPHEDLSAQRGRPTPVRTTRADDRRVATLAIRSDRTRGFDENGEPGDDGILLVIEPRNAAGQPLDATGPLSVVLLDYGKRGEGDAARVARWDLSRAELRRRGTPVSGGISVKLRWPDAPPEHEHLQLNVRYTTPSGRQLDARQDVRVRLKGPPAGHWTPRPAGQPEPATDVARPPAPRGPRTALAPDRIEWRPVR